MTMLLAFLAAGGLGCLLMLLSRRIKAGCALLTALCGAVVLSRAAGALDTLLPGVLTVTGWILAAAGWLGLLFSLCIVMLQGEGLSRRFLSAGTVVFAAGAAFFAVLVPMAPAGGVLASLEKAVTGMGGVPISMGCLLCSAALAALCDELPHPPAALLCGLFLAYCFGILETRTNTESSAMLAMFSACLLMLYVGEVPGCAEAVLPALTVLILQGSGAAWCAAALLLFGLILRCRRENLTEAIPWALGGMGAAVLLRCFTDEGGILRLPQRAADAWESLCALPGQVSAALGDPAVTKSLLTQL